MEHWCLNKKRSAKHHVNEKDTAKEPSRAFPYSRSIIKFSFLAKKVTKSDVPEYGLALNKYCAIHFVES